MRKVQTTNTQCPVCGHKLKGSSFAGYRCVNCKAHFTPTFLRMIRRKQFADMVEKHFSEPSKIAPNASEMETIEDTQFVVEDVQSVEAAALEARGDLNLESVVDTAEWPDVGDILQEKMPDGLLQKKRPTVKEYVPPETEKISKKKVKKKSVKKKKAVKKLKKKVIKKKTKKSTHHRR